MLGSHPNIAIPYESHFYDGLYPLVRRYGALDDRRTRALIAEILRSRFVQQWAPLPTVPETLAAITRPGFDGVVEALMRVWTRQQGKSRWGEKTPQHTLCWRTIVAGFSDLQVIHLVRDGRDVALSYRAAFFGPKHIYPLAQRWALYLAEAEATQAALGKSGFLLVRYEDLLAEPERELRRICGFLGEEFDPAMLHFHERSLTRISDQRNQANLLQPVLSDNVEKWRGKMTAREIRIFESVAGAELERYGYARALSNPRLSRWEALSCRYLEHPPRRVLAMLRNRQGFQLARERLRLRLRLGLKL
jgi:Sulfotransferase family